MNNNKPLQKKRIISKEIGDETMLYSPDGGSINVSNYTAAFVWNLCNGYHSPNEIADLLYKTYEVAEGTELKSEVIEILDSFAELGLLE